jgi:hypothetical protein
MRRDSVTAAPKDTRQAIAAPRAAAIAGVIFSVLLAGLRGAEAWRKEGFTGKLTIIGDEPHEPYDRPPSRSRC